MNLRRGRQDREPATAIQIRDQLHELLIQAGFSEIVETTDLDAVTDNIDRIRQAMIEVVADGYTRLPASVCNAPFRPSRHEPALRPNG